MLGALPTVAMDEQMLARAEVKRLEGLIGEREAGLPYVGIGEEALSAQLLETRAHVEDLSDAMAEIGRKAGKDSARYEQARDRYERAFEEQVALSGELKRRKAHAEGQSMREHFLEQTAREEIERFLTQRLKDEVEAKQRAGAPNWEIEKTRHTAAQEIGNPSPRTPGCGQRRHLAPDLRRPAALAAQALGPACRDR